MRHEEARQVKVGDTVWFGGWLCQVTAIREAAGGPYFRLTADGGKRQFVPAGGVARHEDCHTEQPAVLGKCAYTISV